MGPAGAKRKVDGCSMFAKVMYLADLEEFIPREQGAAVQQEAEGDLRSHGRGLREASH